MKYKKGYKYQLHEDYTIKVTITGSVVLQRFYTLDMDGTLVVFKGYAYDGLTNALDTKGAMTAALVHDVLYQMIRNGQIAEGFRRNADNMFWRLCIKNGTGRFRAWYMHKAVRLMGGLANRKREVLTAP